MQAEFVIEGVIEFVIIQQIARFLANFSLNQSFLTIVPVSVRNGKRILIPELSSTVKACW